MSLTASVGLMAVFLVDFVDMIFISMLGKAELAAAVGYAGAILFFTTSFGIGMAIAAGALVARALGAGQAEEARRRATNALIYGVIFGAIFAAVVWLNLGFLAGLLGIGGGLLVVPAMVLLMPAALGPLPLLPQRKHKPRQLKRSGPLLLLLKKHRESQPQPQPQLRRE